MNTVVPTKVVNKASVLNDKDGLGKNGAQAVMDHLKGLAKKDPSKASLIDHWKSLPRGEAKLDFAMKLKVDREACFMTLSEVHETGIHKRARVTQFWLTEDQVTKEEGLHNYLENPVQQQKLKDILEGLPCRPHERPDLAAKTWKQYDYSQKMVQMDQFSKTSMSLRGEAEVQDHRDFDQMAQQLGDAFGHSAQTRQAARPKPLPKPPKELTPAEQKKEEWLKDVRSWQRDLTSLSKLFLGFKVKGSQLVKDSQSGVTKELLNVLENNYKQSITQDELVSRVIFQNTPVPPDDMDYHKSGTIIQKAKDFLANTADLKARASRIIGK